VSTIRRSHRAHRNLEDRSTTRRGHLPKSVRLFKCIANVADRPSDGTPTSLSVISPQELVPGDQHDSSEIPDSPTGRVSASAALEATVDLDRESAKSESPEFGEPVLGVPPMNSEHAPAEQIHIDVPASNPSTNPVDANLTIQPDYIDQTVDEFAATDTYAMPQGANHASAQLPASSKRKYTSGDTTFAETRQNFDGLRRESGTVFDPIESDGENFNKQQPIQHGKRRKVDLATSGWVVSPLAPASVGNQRRDGRFLIPSLPKSRNSETRMLLGETEGPLHGGIFTQMDGGESAETRHFYSHQRPREQAPGTWTETEVSTLFLANDHGASEPTSVDLLGRGAKEHANRNKKQGQQGTVDKEIEQECPADKVVKKRKAAEEEKEAAERQAASREAAEREIELDRLAEELKAKVERDQAEKLADAERARQAKAKEEEAAEAKAARKATAKEQETAQAQKVAQEKETAERLVREQQAKEKALGEQAEKAMQAADGAKQLEADKLGKTKWTPISDSKVSTSAAPKTPMTYAKSDQQKARRTELSKKRKADEAKAAEAEREREAGRAQKSAQKLADSNAKEAEKGRKCTERHHKEETTVDGEKTVAKKMLQKLRELSVDRSRQSSSPSEPGGIADQRRKSMTPAVPKSSAINSSSAVQDHLLSSSPLASRSNIDTPLRSALKHSNSALRRSVSWIDDAGPTQPAPLPAAISDGYRRRPVKSLVEINKELVDAASSGPKQFSKIKAQHGTTQASSKDPAAKGKVQTKLNVIRDTKMKARVVEPPVTSQVTPQKQTANSSSEDDDIWSVSSDEDPDGNGNAKAGPSSKKSIYRGNSSTAKEGTKPVSALSNIDPALQTIKVEQDATTISASLTRSSSQPTSSSQNKSTSRSPALAESEAVSTISESSSDSDSDSASQPDSNVGSSDPLSNGRNGNMVNNQGTAQVVTVKMSFSPPAAKHDAQICIPELVNGSAKHADTSVDKQLKREYYGSIPEQGRQLDACSNGPAAASGQYPPMDRNGRLPNGIRPAHYRYPTLTQLKAMAESDTPYEQPPQTTVTPAERESEPTSSSDDNSSSQSDDDDDGDVSAGAAVSETGSKPKSGGGFPGLKGVMRRKCSSYLAFFRRHHAHIFVSYQAC